MNDIILRGANGGDFQCTGGELTAAIGCYLPSSLAVLRAVAEDRTDGGVDFSDLETVGEFLIVLADLDAELANGAVRT